jgi:oxygen-dependent protoporphyrinogen oxidase
MKRVAIVGGGIAGLATALHTQDRARAAGLDVETIVLEAQDRVGGNIRTDRHDGWAIEWGPNGFLDNVPTTPALVHRLELEDRVQRANERAAKRFLYRNGKLHLLPSGPIGFLKSQVLSVPGRLRVLLEHFARIGPGAIDETVYEFASRRIGREAASVLVDAMVSGVFAGNIHELSLASTFPKMAAMESEHGSLTRAMIAKMRQRRAARRKVASGSESGARAAELTRPGGPAGPAGTLTSFDSGLDLLTNSLQSELDGAVQLGVRVETIERTPNGSWQLSLSRGSSIGADAVVLALSAKQAAKIVWPLDSEIAELLGEITSASLAVVALGYDARAIGAAPDGFGFLVPRGEGPRILGCLWDSSLFPYRAPDGKVLLRAMIGGAHDPEAVYLEDDELLRTVRDDLATTMGLRAEPILTRIYRHPGGIAQYRVGHGERLASIERSLAFHPGLWIAGSSYYGVSMNSCIEKAAEQGQQIIEWLQHDKT